MLLYFVLSTALSNIVRVGSSLPKPLRRVIADMMEVVDAPFRSTEPIDASAYPPPSQSPLAFFPGMPSLHGHATYQMNQKNRSRATDTCRKDSYGHPTLTPGLFTLFCQHGVCYGFEAMTPESPKVPFQIFKTRFTTPPKFIIYDNACKLRS
jgi:hypothetical protein